MASAFKYVLFAFDAENYCLHLPNTSHGSTSNPTSPVFFLVARPIAAQEIGLLKSVKAGEDPVPGLTPRVADSRNFT